MTSVISFVEEGAVVMSDLVRVGRVDELAPGQTKKFLLTCGGRELEAFVLNHGGKLVAYVNRCCHVPMTMDWVENQLLTEDGAFIQCATHGACYEPESGECVAGPPVGKFLTPVPLTIRDGVVWASCPDDSRSG
jgi:nitrite reductase/ring-hydroxylating ferredoxin subunit